MRCPACEASNPPAASHCEECGAQLPARKPRAPGKEDLEDPPVAQLADEDAKELRPRRRRPVEEDLEEVDDDTISTIIPYRNPRALASYYLGIFSLASVLSFWLPKEALIIAGLAMGAVVAMLALVLGIMGVRYSGNDPGAKGGGHAVIGIVCAIITLLGQAVGAVIYYFINHYAK